MTRHCPDCRQPLLKETYDSVEVDRCADCAGIWFDMDELRRLVSIDPLALLALEERFAPQVTQQKGELSVFNCPGCQGLLHVYHYKYDSPIELNACAECGGFWVQEGELEQMQKWNETHRAPDAEEARRLAVAKAGMESDHTVRRLEGLRWFFDVLRQNKPLWWGNRY